uniref:Copper transporter n=1 Tax=Peronospora matthiolae TaxID=2874970 RepID=A0AAV1UPM3_9STRA
MSAIVDAVFASYDVKNATRWREEDRRHREQEKQWREDAIRRETEWRCADLERERRVAKLESEKRLLSARLQQLQTISQLSAMLSFFSMRFLQDIRTLRIDTSPVLVILYGTISVLEFLCMLLCTLTCTLLLLAVTRFVAHTLEGEVGRLSDAELDTVSPFTNWWVTKCEHEWLLAFHLFRTAASFFLVAIALSSWIVFARSRIAAIVVSMMCLCGLLYYNFRFASRWRYIVQPTTGHRRRSISLP